MRLEQKRQTLSTTVESVRDQAGRWFSLGAGAERTFIQELETVRQKVGISRNQLHDKTETRFALNWQREDRAPTGGLHQINQTLVLDGQLRYRSVDDPLFPRDGNVTELRIGGGSKQALRIKISAHLYKASIWYPVGTRRAVAARRAGVYVCSIALRHPPGIPVPRRWHPVVRGYAFQRLGVREGRHSGRPSLGHRTIEYNHGSRASGALLFLPIIVTLPTVYVRSTLLLDMEEVSAGAAGWTTALDLPARIVTASYVCIFRLPSHSKKRYVELSG